MTIDTRNETAQRSRSGTSPPSHITDPGHLYRDVSDSRQPPDIDVACVAPLRLGDHDALGFDRDFSALRSQLCTEHSRSRPHLDVQLALLECSLVCRLQDDVARSRDRAAGDRKDDRSSRAFAATMNRGGGDAGVRIW